MGVVLYDEPPATYVDLIHFISLDRGNIAYSTAKRTNGEDAQIPNDGIIAVLYDPPVSPDSTVEVSRSATMAQALTLEGQHPEYTSQLQALVTRWRQFIATENNHANQQVPVPATSSPSLSFATKDGQKYDGVTVTRVDPDKLEFMYSDGVATVDFAQLPPAIQKQFGYDPKKAARQATSPKDSPPSTDIPPGTTESDTATEDDLKKAKDDLLLLEETYGTRYQVVVTRKLDPKDFGLPATYKLYQVILTGIAPLQYEKTDENKGNVLDYFYANITFETDFDHSISSSNPAIALLITSNTEFTSSGRAEILAQKLKDVDVTMDDGFSKEVPLMAEGSVNPIVENEIFQQYELYMGISRTLHPYRRPSPTPVPLPHRETAFFPVQQPTPRPNRTYHSSTDLQPSSGWQPNGGL